MTAELVLATLLESARLGNSGPATVAANARRRVDTPGGGGQIPGDTPLASRSGIGVAFFAAFLHAVTLRFLLASCYQMSAEHHSVQSLYLLQGRPALAEPHRLLQIIKSAQPHRSAAGARPSRFQPGADTPRRASFSYPLSCCSPFSTITFPGDDLKFIPCPARERLHSLVFSACPILHCETY